MVHVNQDLPDEGPFHFSRSGYICYFALRRAVPKLHEREKHKNEWISDETWRLVDERVSIRRGTRVRARIQRLVQAIRASLKGERKRRVEAAETGVEELIGGYPLINSGWTHN